METENKPSDTSEICKVSVKIPPFLVEKLEIWFFQVEAQFKIGGVIQEDTKFNYLISQLEPKYIENIRDIINSKIDNKYSECKSRLLELYRESIELGDMKPSQLLQKLRSLATPDISDNLIKTLWLNKLPTSIKNILIVSDKDIRKLAIMADIINEINPSKEIFDAEVSSPPTDRLISKLEDLERQVSVLRLERSRYRCQTKNQSRARSNSQRSFNAKRKYCYYHFRFGPNCLQNKCRPPCSWKESGKLQPADRVATNSSAGIQDCRDLRLFVTDKNTRLRFLVNSGDDISIIPPKDKNRMPSSDYKLYAANGTEIVTYGTKVRNLDIGLRRQFQWPFVIANTNRAIIGRDFLNNFGLVIDLKNKCLIDGITNLSIRGVIQSISDMGNISTLNSSSKVSAILTKYPNLCRPPSDFVEAKCNVKHYIPTRGQPIHSKARRLDPQRLTLAKAESQYMLNNGIIRPSNSPWASPLHLVSKKDESLRPCGDYRRLNAVTLPDRYPIPRLDDFHHILKGTCVYSKIDLCKAFYQIPIAEEYDPKTAIITPFGLFEFNVMSFGLRNATATFQRFMHEVLRNLDFAFVYLDDILVASKTEEDKKDNTLECLFWFSFTSADLPRRVVISYFMSPACMFADGVVRHPSRQEGSLSAPHSTPLPVAKSRFGAQSVRSSADPVPWNSVHFSTSGGSGFSWDDVEGSAPDTIGLAAVGCFEVRLSESASKCSFTKTKPWMSQVTALTHVTIPVMLMPDDFKAHSKVRVDNYCFN
ncbi:hypothetical protein LAZ67_2001306, partial [Cordylochernes scorpioides]